MIFLMAWIFAGLTFYSLIEYVYHRHGGHLKLMGSVASITHLEHHRDPREGLVSLLTKYRQRLSVVLKFNLGFAALLGPLSYWSTGSIGPATLLLAGMNCGYLYSEWFHHRMHHAAPRTRLGAYLWRNHYHHHFSNARVNFGFTSPLWDLLLGTYQAVTREVAVPAFQAPAGLESVPLLRIALRD